MKLLIFYLTNNQRHFTFQHFIKLINQSNKKQDWVLIVLTNDEPVDFYKSELEHYCTDVNYNVVSINKAEHMNYLSKVNFAIDVARKHNIPYMMKCDNDIFLKPDVLDYMIDNLHILEDPKHLTLSPVLSSGIPGIEYFKEQFLDKDAQIFLDTLFSYTHFYYIGGVDYSFLNKYTINDTDKKWNKSEFFKGVKEIDHYYKGIHPIRVKVNNISFINNYIIEHKDEFMKPRTMGLITNDDSPYLCNSIFCIKTDVYEDIVKSSPDLFVDVFDEVPLNKYAWKNNMNHVFVENGFAIHMYYNWEQGYIEHEKYFCKKFFSK